MREFFKNFWHTPVSTKFIDLFQTFALTFFLVNTASNAYATFNYWGTDYAPAYLSATVAWLITSFAVWNQAESLKQLKHMHAFYQSSVNDLFNAYTFSHPVFSAVHNTWMAVKDTSPELAATSVEVTARADKRSRVA